MRYGTITRRASTPTARVWVECQLLITIESETGGCSKVIVQSLTKLRPRLYCLVDQILELVPDQGRRVKGQKSSICTCRVSQTFPGLHVLAPPPPPRPAGGAAVFPVTRLGKLSLGWNRCHACLTHRALSFRWKCMSYLGLSFGTASSQCVGSPNPSHL